VSGVLFSDRYFVVAPDGAWSSKEWSKVRILNLTLVLTFCSLFCAHLKWIVFLCPHPPQEI